MKGYVNNKIQSLCGEIVACVLRAVQGVNGDDGRPGAPGKDGRPVRLHVITLHPLAITIESDFGVGYILTTFLLIGVCWHCWSTRASGPPSK